MTMLEEEERGYLECQKRHVGAFDKNTLLLVLKGVRAEKVGCLGLICSDYNYFVGHLKFYNNCNF